MIIEQDGDLRLDVSKAMRDLSALVSFVGGSDRDLGIREYPLVGGDDVFGQLRQLVSNSNNDDGTWCVPKARGDTLFKVSVLGINGVEDDCAVRWGKGRVFGDRGRMVEEPEGDKMDDETQIPEDEQMKKDYRHSVGENVVSSKVFGQNASYLGGHVRAYVVKGPASRVHEVCRGSCYCHE